MNVMANGGRGMPINMIIHTHNASYVEAIAPTEKVV